MTGTENVALIVGMGEASRISVKEFNDLFIHLLTLKHHFLVGLLTAFADKVCASCVFMCVVYVYVSVCVLCIYVYVYVSLVV